MSHTEYHGSTTFIFNGDYSGDVEIMHNDGGAARVPMSDLLGFLAMYIRNRKIERLESSMTDDEVFGI